MWTLQFVKNIVSLSVIFVMKFKKNYHCTAKLWLFKTSFFWERKLYWSLFYSTQWIVKPSHSWNSNLGWFVSRTWIFFIFFLFQQYAFLKRKGEKKELAFLFILHFQHCTQTFARHFHMVTSTKIMTPLPSPEKWSFKNYLFLKTLLAFLESRLKMLGSHLSPPFPHLSSSASVPSLFLVSPKFSSIYFPQMLSDLFLHSSKASCL